MKQGMIAAVDACYGPDATAAAGITFRTWRDTEPVSEVVRILNAAVDYEPGQFWRRELPCVLSVINDLDAAPSIVVVDGYVWLDDSKRKGLGAHLFEALQGRIPVIGVAKTPFGRSKHAQCVFRGHSHKPLYVTVEGLPSPEAAAAIASMYGEHRIPALLKRVDQLCRSSLERLHSRGNRMPVEKGHQRN